MKFGPLEKKNTERVISILDGASVRYAVHVDYGAAESALEAYRDTTANTWLLEGKPFSLSSSVGNLYIEIADKDSFRVAPQLAELGYAVIPKEALEEEVAWHCASCDYESVSPGKCPTHRTPLVSWEQQIQAKRQRAEKRDRWVALVILIIATIGGGWSWNQMSKVTKRPQTILPKGQELHLACRTALR